MQFIGISPSWHLSLSIHKYLVDLLKRCNNFLVPRSKDTVQTQHNVRQRNSEKHQATWWLSPSSLCQSDRVGNELKVQRRTQTYRHQGGWKWNWHPEKTAHFLLMTDGVFQGWCCFPLWPAGGAVVKRMATETHIHRRVIHKEGHAEGRSRVPVSLFIFISIIQNVCLSKEEGSHVGLSSGLCMSRKLGIDPTPDERTEQRHKVHRWAARWWWRLAHQRQQRLVDWRKQGEGVLLYKHPVRERERERGRERAPVRCGVAVQCSALWERVEVQWCCHGDKLPTISLGSNRMQISLPLPLF